MKAITVEALSKTFSGGTVAVDGIRFSLNQGEIFGFLGPNGAGKTTTVKLLCGMLTPSGGKCQVLGIDPTQNPEQLHEKVGVVTEHAQMYDHMTAWENLQFYGTLFGMSRSECADRAKLLLQRLELADVKDRKLATYSTVCASGFLWPEHCFTVHRFCFWMSRPLALTPKALRM